MSCTRISGFFDKWFRNRWYVSWQAATLLATLTCITINSVIIMYQCIAVKSSETKEVVASFGLFLAIIATSVLVFVSWICMRLISTLRTIRKIPLESIDTYDKKMSQKCKIHIAERYDSSLYMDLGPTSSPWDIKYSHGWGRKQTKNEGVHFKRAIINSSKFLEQSIFRLYPQSSPPTIISLQNLKDTLIAWAPGLDKDILDRYFLELHKAKNTKKEFSEQEYKEVMKLVVSIIKGLDLMHLFKRQE